MKKQEMENLVDEEIEVVVGGEDSPTEVPPPIGIWWWPPWENPTGTG